MGRREKPHVQGDQLAPTQAAHFVLLEDPQQIDLGLGSHLAHFVQKERAPLGHFETSLACAGLLH